MLVGEERKKNIISNSKAWVDKIDQYFGML